MRAGNGSGIKGLGVKIFTYGDSHAAYGFGSSSPVSWATMILGRIVEIESYGVGGATSEVMVLPEYTQRIGASTAAYMRICIGTNDIHYSGVYPEVADIEITKANITTLVNLGIATQKRIILDTLPPHSSFQSNFTNAKVNKLLDLNAWIRTAFAGNSLVQINDAWTDLLDVMPSPMVTGADDVVWYRPGFSVGSVTVSAGGTGYDDTTAFTITHNGGQGCELQAVVSGGILRGVLVIKAGYGYSNVTPPTAVVTGIGSGATVTLAVTGSVVGWTITSGGTGYTESSVLTAPQSSAVAHTSVLTVSSGVITAVRVNVPGFGYTSPPTAIITIGSGAILTAVMGSPRMWRAGLASGDVHQGGAGGLVQGEYLAALLPADTALYKSLMPGEGNLVDSTFTGTAGTLATGMTGSLASGWTASRQSGTSTGVVASKGASSQILTLDPPTKTGGATVTWFVDKVVLLSSIGITIGRAIIAEAQIAVTLPTGISEISLALIDAAGSTESQSLKCMSDRGYGGIGRVSYVGPHRTPVLTVGAVNSAVDRLIIRLTISGNAASAAGIGFGVELSSLALRAA